MPFMCNENFRSPLDNYKREIKEQTGKSSEKDDNMERKHAFKTQLGCLPHTAKSEPITNVQPRNNVDSVLQG